MLLVHARITRCLAKPVGSQPALITKMRNKMLVTEIGVIEEIRRQERYKENKNRLAKVKISSKDGNNSV